MVRSSWAIWGSIRGNKPKSNDHFLFHPFGVRHLQLVLKVVVVDPLVLNDVAVLKKIMYDAILLPCVGELRFPNAWAADFSCFLFGPSTPDKTNSRGKYMFRQNPYIPQHCSVLYYWTDESLPFCIWKKACLQRGPYVIDENNKIPYKKDVTLVNISDTKEGKEKEVSHR